MFFAFSSLLRSSLTRGVFWKFLSVFCFVVATTLVYQIKHYGPSLPPFQIAFCQAFIPLTFLTFLSLCRGNQAGRHFVRPTLTFLLTKDPRNALARALCACVGFGAWFWSLKLLPLGLVGFLRLLGPFITFGGALLFLKERASFTTLCALVGTLLGATLLLNEELTHGAWRIEEASWLHILIPFIAIIGLAGANIFGKRLLKEVSPHAATLSLLSLSSVFLSVFALPSWIGPTAAQWGILLAIGVLDAAAQESLSRALSLTPLSLLVPIGLWRFALLALSGMLFFNEPFRLTLWIGVLLIAAMTGVVLKRG